ncbi:MAG: MBL fold metallo-hydrolase [Solirubrobacteraceae bacterium]|nr:MBL fold metallo-hydrolase [Solirubrobacteraceae bacterium]
MADPQGPSETTVQRHAEALASLPGDDGSGAANAARMLITAAPSDLQIKDEEGRVLWSLAEYGFLEPAEAPESVHPALWRLARLNMNAGLFEVAEGVYQVRGYDISNMTLIEGDEGVIVVDPLVSPECAAAALALYREARGERKVTAVLHTHSHVDHFGGIRGVLGEGEEVPIWAPAGFTDAAVSENVIAGSVMVRRAAYMYGSNLPRGARGQVDVAIGKGVSTGRPSLMAITDEVTETGQQATIDGVLFEFQMVPETEAPAELNFFLPERGALCIVETATQVLHNILTIRGAQVRDALWWSQCIDQSIELFGSRTEVLFAGHHWPTWGNEQIAAFLSEQRDLYRFLHDQTIRLAGEGLNGEEIAERIELPEGLAALWHTRSAYGSMRHNARGIYQRYFGVYDGNPVNLDPLTPSDAGSRYVEAIGGGERALEIAAQALAEGDERWAATLAGHVVFAEPENAAARELQAAAFEQLGYQTENATWRNAYLTGASELRDGVSSESLRAQAPDIVRALPTGQLFDAMGTRINGERAAENDLIVAWNFTDIDEQWTLRVTNGALSTVAGRLDEKAAAIVTTTRATLNSLILQEIDAIEAFSSGAISVDGDPMALAGFLGLLDDPPHDFPIVTPRG